MRRSIRHDPLDNRYLRPGSATQPEFAAGAPLPAAFRRRWRPYALGGFGGRGNGGRFEKAVRKLNHVTLVNQPMQSQ
jgi:hypothetical protein